MYACLLYSKSREGQRRGIPRFENRETWGPHRVVSSLRDSLWRRLPWAYALGFILSPLCGWGVLFEGGCLFGMKENLWVGWRGVNAAEIKSQWTIEFDVDPACSIQNPERDSAVESHVSKIAKRGAPGVFV